MPKPNRAKGSLFSEEELPPNFASWEVADRAEVWVAEVALNLPLTTVYSYEVPDSLREVLSAGQRVEVPFGRGDKLQTGYCVAVGSQQRSSKRLKSLYSVLDREPLIDDSMLKLTRWIADRYLCGWGQVLESVIPAGVKRKSGTREVLAYELVPEWVALLAKVKLPAKQQAVIAVLQGANGPLRVDELCERAGCGTGPINSLKEKGYLRPVKQRTSAIAPVAAPIEVSPLFALNADQKLAVEAIIRAVQANLYTTFLLHGVTGSGKTEVYMQAIAEVVAFGRQAIVLVPEISLTPQTIRRFSARFPNVAVLHSHLTDAERHGYWQEIASGEVQVVVGARSAIFAPLPHLGMIVIDEEHETSFKQDNTPRYHAREVARQRAMLANIPLVLGSATPTLESWQRAVSGVDQLISLPSRVEDRPLPPVVIVDTRDDPYIKQGAGLGRQLLNAMQQSLKAGGQIILFLNVRGFAPVLWCRSCGKGTKCPDCDVTLTLHKELKAAICHSCDYSIPPPQVCRHCSAPGLSFLGIGTERLEAEVRARFPAATVLRMDSDSMRKRGSHATALDAFRHGEVQILLGTQMIAKGLDFPNVTLVGVVDADTSLHQPDVRAAERTFQLVAQVAGRTGRGSKGGRVLVQTSNPDQPAIVHASRHDYIGFANDELNARLVVNAPPHTSLARVVVRGPIEGDTLALAEQIAVKLKATSYCQTKQVHCQGPSPCMVTRLKGLFRFQIQLNAVELSHLQAAWLEVAPTLSPVANLEWMIDVDAMNMR